MSTDSIIRAAGSAYRWGVRRLLLLTVLTGAALAYREYRLRQNEARQNNR